MRFALAILALTSVGACKKKAPEQAAQQPLSGVDSDLQVVMVSPSTIPVDTPTELQVVGTGFVNGAEVRIGERWVSPVRFDNENTLSLTTPGLADGVYDVTVQNPDASSATAWKALVVGTGGGTTVTATRSACEPVTVYFALDMAKLEKRALDELGAQLACYADTPSQIVIEGHADERGTTDYNLALGERRADTVRTHLVRAGVAQAKIRTVSYGEERPADPKHDERAWAKNRRAEVSLR